MIEQALPPKPSNVTEIPLSFGENITYGEMARVWMHHHFNMLAAGNNEGARVLFNNTVGIFFPLWTKDFIVKMNNSERYINERAAKTTMTNVDKLNSLFQLRITFFMEMLSAAGVMQKPDIVLDIKPNWNVPLSPDEVCGSV